jgi:hypothetical protein
LVDVALSKDAVLNVTNSSESFIPIQRIINDKVKLTFNDYPEEAGITESTTKKKMCKTLVLTTTELKVTSVQSMKALSKYKMIDSITNVFDTLQTNRLDNQIWKWFVIFALLFW